MGEIENWTVRLPRTESIGPYAFEMDAFLSPGLGFSAAKASWALVRKLAKGQEFSQELVACAESALEEALLSQLEEPGELLSAIMRHLGQSGVCVNLFIPELDPDFSLPAGVEDWSTSMNSLLATFEEIDPSQINILQLSQEFAQGLFARVIASSRRPGSPLTQFVLVSARDGRVMADPKGGCQVQSEETNNLWRLPTEEEYFERSEPGVLLSGLMSSGRNRIVLHGVSGAGKSVLARREAEGNLASLVWWFRCATASTLAEDCAAFLAARKVAVTGSPMDQVKKFLAQESDWLAVLDDVPDRETVNSLIPSGTLRGTAIITSVTPLAFPLDSLVPVGLLARQEGVQFLRRYSMYSTEELGRVVDVLGGLPLALRQAGTYMQDTGADPRAFVDRIRHAPIHVLGQYAPVDHPNSVVAVHEAALEVAQSKCSDSERLLAVIAVCEPAGIPRTFLSGLIRRDKSGIVLDATLAALERGGLIHQNLKGTVNCHAVTAALTKASISGEVRRELCRNTLKVAVESMTSVSGGLQVGVDSVVPAVDALLAGAEADKEVWASAKWAMSFFAAISGRPAAASEQIARAKAIAVAENSWSSEANRSMGKFVEGVSHALSGNTSAAIPLLEEYCLQVEQVSDFESAVSAYAVLAYCANLTGDVQSAMHYLERAVRIADHSTATHLAAQLIYYASRLATPDEAAERLENLLLQHRGDDDVFNSWLANAAARSLMASGRIGRAIELFEFSLSASRRAGGDEWLDVGRDLNDLGMALLESGDFVEAKKTLELSLDVYLQPGGDLHPYASMPTMHLSRLFCIQGSRTTGPERAALLAEAEKMAETSVELNRVSGESNPDLAASFIALGDVKYVLGLPAEAATYQAKALAIDRAVFGDLHHEAGIDACKLAVSQMEIGNNKRATSWLEFAAKSLEFRPEQNPAASFTFFNARILVNRRLGQTDKVASDLEQLRKLGFDDIAALGGREMG